MVLAMVHMSGHGWLAPLKQAYCAVHSPDCAERVMEIAVKFHGTAGNLHQDYSVRTVPVFHVSVAVTADHAGTAPKRGDIYVHATSKYEHVPKAACLGRNSTATNAPGGKEI